MTLDLNLYRGLIDDDVFYINATINNIDILINISFYNLVVFPNPITFGLNVSFSYKKNGGFINYTCDNIAYQNIDDNNYSIILLCDKVSGGVFNQNNLNKSYLVLDNNNINYLHALENLINSNFYFQINNSLVTFNGNLFQTNLGDISEYIKNIVNKKILSLEGNNVYNILKKVNYSVLNTTNAPLFTYKVINDVNEKKGYTIEIHFNGTDINNLSNTTLDLLIQDVTNTLFYELDLVFYPKVSSTQKIILDSNLLNNSFSKLNDFNPFPPIPPFNIPEITTTLNFASEPIINICIPRNGIQNFKVLNSNLKKTSGGFYVCDLSNVYINSGSIFNIINGVTSINPANISITITNGLENYGTLNCDFFNLILDGFSTNFNNVCPNFDTYNYWANHGCINLGNNSLLITGGAELNPKGNMCCFWRDN